MSTLTVTELRHVIRRPRRLSLIASSLPPIFNLPAELVVAIFEHAIPDSKPTNLALVCKALCRVLDTILYRTVVLDSSKTVRLFHRTVASKGQIFLKEHVKKLVVTWRSKSPQPQIHDIITACAGLRVLVTPSYRSPVNILAAMPLADKGGPFAITIQSFDGDDLYSRSSAPVMNLMALNHLRFCEPSDMWHPPSSMLTPFGPLPQLSYLQFARCANANEDNDIIFADDIRKILHTYPSLKMLVVSIFPNCMSSASDSVTDSSIWGLMCGLRDEDSRVLVLPGDFGEWKDGWYNRTLWGGYNPVDFWRIAKKAAEGQC